MFSKSQLTQYAHEYLSGSNLVPIGALDDAFFKAECRRLWGPAPSADEVAREKARATKILDKLIKARSKLLGPRGGAPKSGVAARQFKELQYNIDMVMRSL